MNNYYCNKLKRERDINLEYDMNRGMNLSGVELKHIDYKYI